jgi:trimeric autotransporter adhesin
VSGDRVAAGPRTRTFRAGWGWLLLSTAARFYLVFLGALASSALVPMLFGLSGSVVQSGSMEPHISTGDVVLSHSVGADAPTPMGRVITFRAPTGSAKSGLVLHRLVAANKNGTLVTAGDANKDPDSTPLARPNIISMGVLLIPWIGLPSIWVGTGAFLPLGLWVLLTMGALTIGAVDAASRQPPSEIPPEDPASPTGPDAKPVEAAPVALPRKASIAARLSARLTFSLASLPTRLRIDTGSVAIALVAVFTATALAMAPLGLAAAAFTARTLSIGNTWGTAGPATRLAFPTAPSDSGSTVAFGVQPVVVVLDAHGHTVDLSNAPVTLSLTTAAGATLTCTANPKSAVAGVATFAGCAVDDAGTYTLTATSGTLTSAVSTTFTITTGSATSLSFTTDPSSSTGGVAFGTQPMVAVQDAGGNTVTSSAAPVTLSITTPAGATLTCTANPKAAIAGVATFAGCKIDKAGTYSLTATSGTLASDISADLIITVGSANKLVFTTNPSFSNAGIAFFTQPVVAVQDAGGNALTSSTASVTLSITTPAGATLTCATNPKVAVAGMATFVGCKIDNPGTYTLTAVSAGLSNAVSSSITITVGSTTKLVFTTNPSSSTGGTAFVTQPVVAVQDAAGNTVTSSTVPVSLVITTPGGAVLTCTANPKAAVAGLVTFAGCNVDKPGTYTLTAASSGLTNAVSASFTVTVGLAAKLAFTTSPSTSLINTTFGTQPVVTVQDAGGNTVTTSGPSVTLAITPPTGGAALTNCSANPRSTSSGVATFSSCRISIAGTYTLTATSGTLTSAVSASFTISSGAVKLAFTRSPSNTAVNTTFGTSPRVAMQDAAGTTVTTTVTPVTLTITPPAGGAVLTCTTNPANTSSGVARFSGCKIDKIGTYTLTATASGLTSAVSASFTITVGPATKLAFTTGPSSSTGGGAFATQPVVAVQDSSGNTTAGTNSVTLSITTAAGAILSCTSNPNPASSGVASFAGCSIDKAGTYTLTATASGLTSAVSASLTIAVGSASKLGFTTNPSSSSGGTAFGTQPVVAIQDPGGNTVTSGTTAVTLSITTPAGAVLTCPTNPANTVAGVAAFAGCSIDKSGTYTLTATASALTSAVSPSFTISAGSATKLVFTTSPSSSTGGTAFGTQPVVAVQDAMGNTVTSSTASVTLSITTPLGASLTCTTNPRTASSGVASFAGCKIDRTGTYTLTAATGGLTSALSTSLTITAGSATKLAFTMSPSNTARNVAFTTQPVVTVQDAGGNTVTSSSTSITLSITSGGATLTCTQNPTSASSGVAIFVGCRINTAGTFTLTGSASGGLTSAVSNSLIIS